MALVDFNINDHVMVRLSEKARLVHREKWEPIYLSLGLKYEPRKEDSEGWSRWQLWEFMNLYGPYMPMVATGSEPIIATTIRFEIK